MELHFFRGNAGEKETKQTRENFNKCFTPLILLTSLWEKLQPWLVSGRASFHCFWMELMHPLIMLQLLVAILFLWNASFLKKILTCRSKEHLRPRSLGLRRLLSRRIRLQGWLWAALDAPLYSENSPSVRKGARGDSTPTARESNMQTRRRQTPRAALFVISKQTRGHERSLLTDPSPPGLKTTVSIAQGWR